MKVQIEESWQRRLQDEFDKPYFEKLVTFVKSEYKKTNVLPPGHQIFHVFNACPFEKVKIFAREPGMATPSGTEKHTP